MTTRICPVCGADYLDWVATCTVCGVALVSLSEAPDPLRLPEDQQVVYELGGWPLGMQAGAAQSMAESGIPHAWAGTDLVVQVDHEAAVDALMEAIETAQPGIVGADHLDEAPSASAGIGEGDDRLDEQVDEDQPVGALEYELDEWSLDDRTELSRLLAEGGIPYRWEPGDLLVVAAADEALVESLLDQVEFPDALAAEPDDAEDEASFELMSGLFVAADRLKGNPRDPDGISGLAVVVDEADIDRPPFGVEPALWRRAVEEANDLADRMAGAGDADGDGFADDVVDDDGEPVYTVDDVMARAGALRDLLRPFV